MKKHYIATALLSSSLVGSLLVGSTFVKANTTGGTSMYWNFDNGVTKGTSTNSSVLSGYIARYGWNGGTVEWGTNWLFQTGFFGADNYPYMQITNTEPVSLQSLSFDYISNHNFYFDMSYQLQLQIDTGSGFTNIGNPITLSSSQSSGTAVITLNNLILRPGTYKIRWMTVLSGSPDTFTDWVTLDNVDLQTQIALPPSFSVGTFSTPNGQYGTQYTPLQLQAFSGYGPYTWSIVKGSLPKGLTLSTDGVITGTPTGPNGTSTFTVQVKDANGQTATQALALTIQGAPALRVTTATLQGGHMGATYQAQLQANGVSPFTWTLASGNLPPGLSLSSGGQLSGTPTTSGTFTFTVSVTDASGQPVTKTLTMDVEPMNPNQRLVSWNGQAHSVPTIVRNNTTYMPIWYVMQYLKQAGIQSSWNGNQWNMTTQNQANLANLQVGQGGTGIYLNGTLVQRVNTVAASDPSTGNDTTYMPIWYVMQALKRVQMQSTWDGTTWTVTK